MANSRELVGDRRKISTPANAGVTVRYLKFSAALDEICQAGAGVVSEELRMGFFCAVDGRVLGQAFNPL